MMNIKRFVLDWIAISNSYNTSRYLEYYHKDAVLDDPSVGRRFVGHGGIKDYYTRYFIGYKTQAKLLKLNVLDNTAHLEVEFTGDFPEREIKGMFDFTFQGEKIAAVKAELI